MISRVSQRVAVSVVYVAAMFMTIMDVTIVNVVANLAAYHIAFLVAAGVALTIHDADAASTMVRRGRQKAKPLSRAAPVDLTPGQGSVQA